MYVCTCSKTSSSLSCKIITSSSVVSLQYYFTQTDKYLKSKAANSFVARFKVSVVNNKNNCIYAFCKKSGH